MDDYDKTEFCMIFSNEEIRDYLINPLRDYPDFNFRVLSSNSIEISENSNEKIGFVCFDGDRENFYIRFDGDQTSIFISDEHLSLQNNCTFNEEFMCMTILINNIIYQVIQVEMLRDKPYQEILKLFREFIILLVGANKILIKETIVSQTNFEYPKCESIVNIFNNRGTKKYVKYDNIVFFC